jgi:hypothetical protein
MSQNQNQYVKAVVYDLESENQIVFSNSEMKDVVRSCRVRCVQMLHSLGIPCTESVILISPNRVGDIQNTINRVKELYSRLNEELRSHNFNVQLRPIIEVLELTVDQADRLIPIAERRLIAAIDQAIEHVNEVIESLNEITEASRRQRIRANLRRLSNNWQRIFEYARQLGIDVSRDYQYLVDLIDSAIERCEG